jgi:hypothetical protein
MQMARHALSLALGRRGGMQRSAVLSRKMNRFCEPLTRKVERIN